jgi:hypothetical protein
MDLCTLLDCTRPIRCKGLCSTHYRKQFIRKPSKCTTPEYSCWSQIKQRCLNPNDQDYPDYGARGIYVCEAWLHDFDAFYAHVGARPSGKHSLDRIDNDKGYEPGNVRWTEWNIQAINRRKLKNKSGVTGVYYREKTNQWIASIHISGKRTRQHFNNKEAAVAWRKEAEAKYYQPLLAS